MANVAVASETFHRDKPTGISYAQASCVGWYFFASGPAITLLRDDLHLSRTLAATHSIAMATGGVLAGICAGSVIKRFGRGSLLRLASVVMALGVLLLTTGHHLYITLPGGLLATMGGATVIQSTAAFLSQHQKKFASGSIAELHGYAAFVGALAPFVMGVAVGHGHGWRSTLQAMIMAVIVVEILRGRSVALYGAKPQLGVASEHHDVPGKLTTIFWWACAVMVCTSGVEASVMLWSSDYLRTHGGLGAGGATAGMTCLVGAMAAARLSAPALTKRWTNESLYVASLGVSIIGFTAFWLLHSPIPMLVALTITGLGISLHFPFGIQRSIQVSGGRPDKAASRIASTTGAAGGIAPFAMGALADHFGIEVAMCVVPLLLICALVIAIKKPVTSQ
jgi:fucose permease